MFVRVDVRVSASVRACVCVCASPHLCALKSLLFK